MKKTWFTLVVLAVFAVVGCISPQRQSSTVYFTFPGANGEANSYIVANGGKAAVIDPADPAGVIDKLNQAKLKPEYVILTHGHFDHIGGVDAVKREFPAARVLIHPRDMDKLADPEKNLSARFGTEVTAAAQASPIIEGQSLKLGDDSMAVIFTPGHTPGSICLKVGELLFTGDTLFRGSVGRTDFPGSSEKDLEESLQKIKKFPADVRILPGHGDVTTLGEELKSNVFLK